MKLSLRASLAVSRGAALVLVLTLAMVAGCSDGGTHGTFQRPERGIAVPKTPAGEQLGWFLAQTVDGEKLTEQEYRSHFTPEFRSQATHAQLTAGLSGGELQLVEIHPGQTPHHLRGTMRQRNQKLGFYLTVDADTADHPVSGLLIAPEAQPARDDELPETWAQLKAEVKQLAPQAALTISEVTEDGQCRPIHGLQPDTMMPTASVVKLWVLGAVAEKIRKGDLAFEDVVVVDAALATLPSGVIQDEPGGTKLTVRDRAYLMISISDNTATDHLIKLVGREAVEAQFAAFDMANPAPNRPMLTVDEVFTLALVDYPALMNRWQGSDEATQRALLESPEIRDFQTSIEDPASAKVGIEARWQASWMATPNDVCRAYAGLEELSSIEELAPLQEILSLEDGGLALDDETWTSTWFKGGNLGGVLRLSYRATHVDGRSIVVDLALADPERVLDPEIDADALTLVRGAFELAAD